jgi:RND family efflux transporter MFP subunit
MTNRHAHSLIRFLRHVVGPDGSGRDADDRLLLRFARERDQAAFAALVARHGPMVLGVCGRVLRDANDVEDAFQATFLVLARKARSLASPHLLAPWLYGVARRTALEARLRGARRRARERPIVDTATADPAARAAWADLRPVLDEEIARLPERYRVPFVMCYLEGRTNGDAARLIGCPEGTVASRLSWARQRLRARLTRRGVTLSAGVLAALLTGRAAVAPALAGCTAEAAASFVGTAPAVPAQVGSLAGKVLKQMFWTKMRKATGLLLTLFLVVGGGGALVGKSQGGGEPTGREVIVARPLARDVADEEDFRGVTVVDSTEVRSRLAGTMGKVHFKDGAEVKKGQLLVEIDPRPFQAEVDQAEANVAQSEAVALLAAKDFEATKEPEPRKLAAVEADKAKASLAAAKATRDVTKANLERTRLSAPTDGRAYAQTAAGKTVRADEAVVLVVGPGMAYVDFEAPLRLLPLLGDAKGKAGLPVAVGLTGDKGLPRRGTVSLTGARVNADKGTLHLRAVVPNDGIKPGETARVCLGTGKPSRALLVPQGAVRAEKSEDYLIVVNDKNETERRRVEVGSSKDGLRTVTAGLEADDWVVLDSAFGADPGAAVAPRKVSLLPEESGKSRPAAGAKTVFLKDNGLSITLPLEHASAAEAARAAKVVYRDHLAPKGRLVISVDERTNSLSVEGTTEQVLEVVKLVAGLEELGRRNTMWFDAKDRWRQVALDVTAETDRMIAESLIKGGGPRLGVTVDPLTPALVEQLNLPAGVGLLVTDVVGGSPAAKVGIQANDVLVKIDGAQIPADVDDFVKLIASLKSDTPMDVVVMRKGKRQNLGAVRLADGPAPAARARENLEGRIRVNEIRSRIDALESDVAVMKDRVTWSERMLKKGYLSAQQAEADRALLEKLKLELERARKELEPLPPKDRESIEKWLKYPER